MKSNRRNCEIDLYRFVFAVIIVLFHSRSLFPNNEGILFKNGAYAVEFFSILSGYLMMASINKKTSFDSISSETLSYLKRKYFSVFFEILIMWIFGIVFFSIVDKLSIKSILSLTIKGLPELFLLQGSGLLLGKVNSVTWYISSMIISTSFLYPLIIKYRDTMTKVTIPFITLMMLGWFCQTYNHIRTPLLWTGFFYKGTLRVFLEICLGIIAYNITQYLKEIRFKKISNTILTILKYLLFIYIMLYLWYGEYNKYDFISLFAVMFFVSLVFYDGCIDKKYYNHTFLNTLGKYSFSLYLSHHFYAIGLTKIFRYSSKKLLIIYVLLSFITAFLLYHISIFIRHNFQKHAKKIKYLFVES